MTNKEITVQLADFIETTQISGIPDSVVQSAKPLIIDFLGVTTAGSVEEPSRIIQDFVREQGGRGDSTLIGTPIQAHAAWTSLANGIAGHALDFDDVSLPMYGHPTTAVLPACLA
ncbi:MAG: MmgE/PrpD family protein, partial [Pseudomonadota bacterium]